ncbi:MAG: hypothetical protein H7X80_09165 [bacterium]|nr:hypothetical protein [Candidatus Kapabacteria bacterium]
MKSIPAVMVKNAIRMYDALQTGDSLTIGGDAADINLRRSLYGPVAIDWGLANSFVNARTSYTGSLSASMPFMFGVLGVRGRANLSGDAGAVVDAGIDGLNWRFALPEVPMLRNLSFGVSLAGAASTYNAAIGGSSRGTETPYFGTREISGESLPGWWVELRDGAQLLDAVRVGDDGRYSFEVPMVGARVVRTIKMLGPHGEKQSQMRTLAVGTDMLPLGDVQWNVGGTSFMLRGERAMSGSFRISSGIHDRMTLDVGARMPGTLMTRMSADSVRFSISARLALFDASSVSVMFDPHSYRFGTSFGITAIEALPIRVRLDSIDLSQKTFDATMSTRFAIGPLRFSAYGHYINRWNRHGYEMSPALSTQLLGVGMTAALRAGRVEEYDGVGEDREVSVRERLDLRMQLSPPPFWHLRFRFGSTYDLANNILGESNVGLSFPLFRIFNVSASYGIRGTDWKNGSFGAGVGLTLPFARGNVSASHSSGRTSVYSRLNGGMVISPAGIDFTNSFAASRIHLFVRGYHDKNANGTYDGDDVLLGPAESDLWVENGGKIASGSEFSTVPAMRNCLLRVNPEQFAGDGLYPLRASMRIAMPAGGSEVIDIPFARGIDLYGEAVINMPSGNRGKIAALFGVKVRLVSIDGIAEYESEFINDGTYLLTGVAHGEYRLLIDERELSERGLEIESMPETFIIGEGTETLPRIIFVPIGTGDAPEETDEWID